MLIIVIFQLLILSALRFITNTNTYFVLCLLPSPVIWKLLSNYDLFINSIQSTFKDKLIFLLYFKCSKMYYMNTYT